MLLISDEALDLIAGGYPAANDASNGGGGGGSGGGGGDIPSITISGELPPEEGSDGFGFWPPSWGGGGGAGNEGSSGSQPVSTPQPDPAPSCPPVHSSPIPANAPKDVDMNVLRNTMLDVANQIKGMDSNIEHGAIVVRSADGRLRVGAIANGDAMEVSIPVALHAGDVIVGYIHSHPSDRINQTLPSLDDFSAADDLRKKSYTDKGMMLYILDNKSGDVFEYHADTPRHTTTSGANITDDTSQPCG